MGFSFKLVGFPLLILGVLVMMSNSGNVTGTGEPVTLTGTGANNNANIPTFTCTSTSSPCFPTSTLPSPSQITCHTTSGNACLLYNGCNNVPTGAFCVYLLFIFPFETAFQNGVTIVVDNSGATTSTSAASASSTFQFGDIGPAGFIVMIGIAIGVAALAGISVFSSGENAESVHIIFMGGFLLGLWGILSAAEGFLTGNASSFFVQMNAALNGMGSGFYVVLTLIYTMGVIASISRGGTN